MVLYVVMLKSGECFRRPVMQIPFAVNALGAAHTVPGKTTLQERLSNS